MPVSKIHFHSEKVSFKPTKPSQLKKWLYNAAKAEGFSIGDLNYVFCSDVYLLKINKEYLNHTLLTDIITFDNSEKKGVLEGDIFISIPRIRENAKNFNVFFELELKRVMIHGLLHLMGYRDKTKAEKTLMRKKEDTYLSL